MGISTNAFLIMGLKYTDIPLSQRDFIDEMIDTGDLDGASPWYDSDRCDWIVGVIVQDSDRNREIDVTTLNLKIDNAREVFFTLTCLEGKLFMSPNVT